MFNFPLIKKSQEGKTAREKQYFQYCQLLRLVVFTRFRANRDCLLIWNYMLTKSAWTVSCELYWEILVYIGLTSYD